MLAGTKVRALQDNLLLFLCKIKDYTCGLSLEFLGIICWIDAKILELPFALLRSFPTG